MTLKTLKPPKNKEIINLNLNYRKLQNPLSINSDSYHLVTSSSFSFLEIQESYGFSPKLLLIKSNKLSCILKKFIVFFPLKMIFFLSICYYLRSYQAIACQKALTCLVSSYSLHV